MQGHSFIRDYRLRQNLNSVEIQLSALITVIQFANPTLNFGTRSLSKTDDKELKMDNQEIQCHLFIEQIFLWYIKKLIQTYLLIRVYWSFWGNVYLNLSCWAPPKDLAGIDPRSKVLKRQYVVDFTREQTFHC